MSRKTETSAAYVLSFGVDNSPMGCFFQLWELAAKGEDPEADAVDQPQIEADEVYGLRINNQKSLERNPKLARAINPLKKLNLDRLQSFLHLEETIIDIGKSCNMNITKNVYALWD